MDEAFQGELQPLGFTAYLGGDVASFRDEAVVDRVLVEHGGRLSFRGSGLRVEAELVQQVGEELVGGLVAGRVAAGGGRLVVTGWMRVGRRAS